MRNALGELPVFLACIYGGMVIGMLAFLLRLPKTLADRKRRRISAALRILFAAVDISICIMGFIIAAATLYAVNGMELRIYALTGLFIGAAASVRVLGMTLPARRNDASH